MSDKHLQMLTGIAAVLLIVTIILYSGISFGGDAFRPGAKLLVGLDPAKITGIVIRKGDSTVTIEKSGDGFTLKERNGYPASVKKINDLLIKCMEITLAEKVSDSKETFADLGVVEGGKDAVSVSFLGAEGKPLAGFIKGGTSNRGGGAYVRRADGTTSYTTADNLAIETAPTSYMDTDLVTLKKEDIAEVSVESPAGNYVIVPGADKKPQLKNVPAGRKAEESEVTDTFNALVDLTFTDVSTAADKQLKFDHLYRCTLESGLVYLVRTAQDGDKYFAELSAAGPQVDQVQISRTESDAELKKKEALLLAADKANEINQNAGRWVYELPSWQAEKLRMELKSLLEEK